MRGVLVMYGMSRVVIRGGGGGGGGRDELIVRLWVGDRSIE